MSSWDRQARGDARALRPDRLFRDLNDDLLALFQNRVDARGSGTPVSASPTSASPVSSFPTTTGFAFGLAGLENALEVVADVEKSGLFQSDIDKGCLHAGKYAADSALYDVSNDALVSLALDMEFGKLAALDQRDPGFPRLRINHNFVAHDSTCPAARPIHPMMRSKRFAPPALASRIKRLDSSRRNMSIGNDCGLGITRGVTAEYAVRGATCLWATLPSGNSERRVDDLA